MVVSSLVSGRGLRMHDIQCFWYIRIVDMQLDRFVFGFRGGGLRGWSTKVLVCQERLSDNLPVQVAAFR